MAMRLFQRTHQMARQGLLGLQDQLVPKGQQAQLDRVVWKEQLVLLEQLAQVVLQEQPAPLG
jgi:hypothetical protein